MLVQELKSLVQKLIITTDPTLNTDASSKPSDKETTNFILLLKRTYTERKNTEEEQGFIHHVSTKSRESAVHKTT